MTATGIAIFSAPSLVSMRPAAMRKAKLRYWQQESNASRRGIPWQIGFASWIAVWHYSGHWHQRGRGRGKYCMSRPGDRGPYHEDNVVIILYSTNAVENALRPRSDAAIASIRLGCKRRGKNASWLANVRAVAKAKIGTRLSPQARANIGAGQARRRARERAEREASP